MNSRWYKFKFAITILKLLLMGVSIGFFFSQAGFASTSARTSTIDKFINFTFPFIFSFTFLGMLVRRELPRITPLPSESWKVAILGSVIGAIIVGILAKFLWPRLSPLLTALINLVKELD